MKTFEILMQLQKVWWRRHSQAQNGDGRQMNKEFIKETQVPGKKRGDKKWGAIKPTMVGTATGLVLF